MVPTGFVHGARLRCELDSHAGLQICGLRHRRPGAHAVPGAVADRRIETVASLKGLHRATGPGGNTEISVAPDGSPVFTRDIGSQEIYALTLKWP